MLREISGFDHSRFNGLPDIEAADAAMKAAGLLPTALAALGPVFAKHKMFDRWGISLLHNHWLVTEGELPIQEATAVNAPREFETRPRDKSFTSSIWPSVLAVKEGSDAALEAVEFSTRWYAQEGNAALTSEFIRDFCMTLCATGLDRVFGLIAPQPVNSTGFEFVEFNPNGRVSILRETTIGEIDRSQLIETSWRLIPDEVAGKCEASCFSKCTISDMGHSHEHPKAHKPG